MNIKLIKDMIDALDTAIQDIYNAYKALEKANDSGIHTDLAAQKKEIENLCDELEDLCGYYERELANRKNGVED